MSGRGARTCRSMALRARAAATRFVRRRSEGRARGTWFPATMRWRRRRRPTPTARTARAAAPSRATVWAPRFHLHFDAIASGRVAPCPSAAAPARSTSYRTHTMLVHGHAAPMRLVTVGGPRRGEHPGSRPFSATAVTSAKTQVAEATRSRPTRAAIAPPLGPRAAARLHHPPFLGTPRASHPSPRREAQRGRFVPALRHRERERPPFQRWPTRREESAPRGAHGATSSLPHLGRAPELLWRRTPRAVGPAADVDLASPPTLLRRSMHPLPHAEAAPEPPPVAVRPAPRPLAALDPAAIDRLADDVIRRIEKRARIERERRGR